MENLQKPNKNLGWAIWGLILFWPTAIAALVNSIQTNSLWEAGKYDEAVAASNAAKKWGKLSVILGSILIGIVIFIYIILVVAFYDYLLYY